MPPRPNEGAGAAGQPVEVVARMLDLTPRRVQQLAKEGVLPTLGRGRYPLVACVHAYVKYWRDRAERRAVESVDGRYDLARTRKIEAEALRAESAYAKELGHLVPASDVVAAAEDEAARVRGVVTQIATEFAPMIAATCACTLRDASAALREVTDGVLARLADPDSDEDEPAP